MHETPIKIYWSPQGQGRFRFFTVFCLWQQRKHARLFLFDVFLTILHMCQGLNSHYFHIKGMVINPIVGVYIPIIRIPIKGGRSPIPNIATFDHGTYQSTYSFRKRVLQMPFWLHGETVDIRMRFGVSIGLLLAGLKNTLLNGTTRFHADIPCKAVCGTPTSTNSTWQLDFFVVASGTSFTATWPKPWKRQRNPTTMLRRQGAVRNWIVPCDAMVMFFFGGLGVQVLGRLCY